MNAYEKAQQLGLTGTDAEIVAILKTLTQSDIPGKALGKWLGERNLLSWDGTAWFGTLQTLLDAGQITGTAADGIKQLKAVLVGPRGDGLETTNPLWAQLVFTTISGIAQASQDAAALIDSFYSLDGGRPYKDLTTTEYAAQRSAAELLAEKQAVVASCRTTVNALAAKATAVNAWLDALNLSTKTVQELQAYCDALLASETGNP